MRTIRTLSIALAILFALVGIVFYYLMREFGLYLIDQYNFLPCVLPEIILCLILSLLGSSKMYKIIVIPIICISAFTCLLQNIMLDIDYTEYHFVSPNNSNTLIIREGAFLLGADIRVYEKKYLMFRKEFENSPYISTDDGYEPFKAGKYSLDWTSENEVTLNYYTNLGKGSWETIHITFPQ